MQQLLHHTHLWEGWTPSTLSQHSVVQHSPCVLVSAVSEAVPCSRAQTPLLSFRCLITLWGEQDNSHLWFTATVTATEVQVQGTLEEKNISYFLMWLCKLINSVLASWRNAENTNWQESLQVRKHQVQRPSKQAHPTKRTSRDKKPSPQPCLAHALCNHWMTWSQAVSYRKKWPCSKQKSGLEVQKGLWSLLNSPLLWTEAERD